MSLRRPTLFVRQFMAAFAFGAAALSLVGCASAPPPAAPIQHQATSLEQAAAFATDALLQSMRGQPGRFDKPSDRIPVVADPTLDAASGQQTQATLQLDRHIADRIAADYPRVELLPFQADAVARASHLLTGVLSRDAAGFRVDLALVEVKSGDVIAQAWAVAPGQGVDMQPLAYYRDSPVLLRDEAVDGYVRTSRTPAGGKADAGYLSRIATAAVIHDANRLYNAANYQEALGQYRAALNAPTGEQMRALNGIYLSNLQLGRTAEAEEAFGKVVAFGIAHRQLGVKFLFNPGSTEFWSDPKVNSAYAMWLRQIARQSQRARACMNIVGHTSRTGTEAINDALSLKRAAFIRQRLGQESSAVATRAKALGMGSRQNIVGSGSDDVVDALDRRVEFEIVDCGA